MTAPHSISGDSIELLRGIKYLASVSDDPNALKIAFDRPATAEHRSALVAAVNAYGALRTPALPSGVGEIEAVRQKMTRLKETECRHSGQLSEALLYGLHRAVEKYLMAIASSPAPHEGLHEVIEDDPTPPFSRWADTIEAASLAISPKGSKELDALAAEVRAGGVALISRLRGMPSSLNDACRTMEEAADVLCGGVAQAAPEPEAYRETVRRVAAVREKRMAEMREALERIRNFPHDKTACEQAMSQIAGEALAIPSTNHSPPDIQASHNSGERDPSVMPDWTGGETNSCGRCIRCLDAGFTATAEDPIPPSRKRMVVCQHCGNKRCPCATYHRNPCTESNWAGQPGSIFGPALPSTEGK